MPEAWTQEALVKTIDLIRMAQERDASDLVLKVGAPPQARIHGDLVPLGEEKLMPADTERFAHEVTGAEEWGRFERDLELDLALQADGCCRCRVNVFRQRGSIGVVFRLIPNELPTIEGLGLPKVASDLAMRPRGLVLVTGPAGSGKSATLAAMVDHRNRRDECHIMTVEDPIEYVHSDQKALVNQRQVGRDTASFNNALKFVLRQDPDVILIGEMRDLETIGLAITAAETGHLALATLHTSSAHQTVSRVIDVFPTHAQQQVRMQMSVNLVGVLSQKLVKRADGKGRVAAFEVMMANSAVRNMIRENKTHMLSQILQTGSDAGMVSMNRALAELVRRGVVDAEEAMAKSEDPDELATLLPPSARRMGGSFGGSSGHEARARY
jgi:twitching motility protein PilT